MRSKRLVDAENRLSLHLISWIGDDGFSAEMLYRVSDGVAGVLGVGSHTLYSPTMLYSLSEKRGCDFLLVDVGWFHDGGEGHLALGVDGEVDAVA